MSLFSKDIKRCISWCNYNKSDINWIKTKAMFISKKLSFNDENQLRLITFPSFLDIDNYRIEVVNRFKLLGVFIDNKLNFLSYVANLRKSVNIRLYSIKKLFYLPFCVKLQFFKTFILPFFDYCSSLFIYFPKRSIQKIANSFFICLYKLFNFCFNVVNSSDFNNVNNKLESYGLNCFQHRVIQHLAIFSFKIINFESSPITLRKLFISNLDLNKGYNLRNINDFAIHSPRAFNNHYMNDFSFFFSKFSNDLLINDLSLPLSLFKKRIKNNVNIFFLRFTFLFNKFDLNFNTVSRSCK